MILYQDSDSICKRYLNDEEGITETRTAMDSADVLASSMISYAEVRGVLARARRGRRIRSSRQYDRITAEFEQDWQDHYKIGVSADIVTQAGQLAAKHFLTGIDALQLASAVALVNLAPDLIQVSTWDKNSGLRAAFVTEGLVLAHEVTS